MENITLEKLLDENNLEKSDSMNTIKLLLPNKKYKQSYKNLLMSAQKEGDYKELGNALIKENETFDDMLRRVENRRIGKSLNSRDVSATIFWIISNNEVVGTIDYYNKHIDRILIACFSDNVASSKVIEKNGGILECKYFDKLTNKYISRYWIEKE